MDIQISKATQKDIDGLATMATKAFYKAHKEAIPKDLMEPYLKKSFSKNELINQLSNPSFEYNLLFYKNQIAGYSKVIFNTENEFIKAQNVTKMERLYLDEVFFNLGLGKKLFDFNMKLAKENNQKGIWLFVWIKNERAIQFYKKVGFKIIGAYDFPVSGNETRPNHVMYLEF